MGYRLSDHWDQGVFELAALEQAITEIISHVQRPKTGIRKGDIEHGIRLVGTTPKGRLHGSDERDDVVAQGSLECRSMVDGEEEE
jgi:hypothetical protein